jgi:hypothetical protein
VGYTVVNVTPGGVVAGAAYSMMNLRLEAELCSSNANKVTVLIPLEASAGTLTFRLSFTVCPA